MNPCRPELERIRKLPEEEQFAAFAKYRKESKMDEDPDLPDEELEVHLLEDEDDPEMENVK